MPNRNPGRFARTDRINEMLREVIAEALEEIVDDDPRLVLVTVTGVRTDPDLGRAKVFWASLADDLPAVGEALEEHRKALQREIARQTKLRRTPILRFEADPARLAGQAMEDLLRDIPRPAPQPAPDAAAMAGEETA